jgi:lysophospholipase L1-like esterase
MDLVALVFPRLTSGSSQTEARLLIDALSRYQVPTVDLRAALTEDVAPTDVRIDSLHPNAEGHRRAADAVFEFIEGRGRPGGTSGR